MGTEKVNQPEADKADNHAVVPQNPQIGINLSQTPDLDPACPSPQKVLPKLNPSQRWLLVGLSTCCTLAAIGAFSFLCITSLPPKVNCHNISPLSADMDRLYCVQEAARSGKIAELKAGLSLVEKWTPEHPLYHEAQKMMADWSRSILRLAHQKIAQNDLKGAVELANQIPKSSPLYKRAQLAIVEWQKQWHKGEGIYATAQKAIKKQDWNQVFDSIWALKDLNNEQSQQQADALSQQVRDEKLSRNSLKAAQELAETGQPEKLSAAIALVSKINHKTYTWSDTQPILNKWSETLLSLAFSRWQQSKLDEAMAYAQQVTANPHLFQEAENLIFLCQAHKLAIASTATGFVTEKQFWSLVGAVVVAQQIQPESRFYAQTQTSIKSWQAQLQDITQLQLAQLTASFAHPQALKFAIAQAQQIGQNRPQRLQAQTLVGYWRHEIELLEDSPYLARAQELAKPETVLALQAAITEANQIPMGRVLRGEAQGLVYQWQRQIEVIQDQPFLNMARVLARQGKLSDAIQTATIIRPGRTLYVQAQAAINDWQAEIHRTEIAQVQSSEEESNVRETQRKVNRNDEETSTSQLNHNETPPETHSSSKQRRHTHSESDEPSSRHKETPPSNPSSQSQEESPSTSSPSPLSNEDTSSPSRHSEPQTKLSPASSDDTPPPINESSKPQREVTPVREKPSQLIEDTPIPLRSSPKPQREVAPTREKPSQLIEDTPIPRRNSPGVNGKGTPPTAKPSQPSDD